MTLILIISISQIMMLINFLSINIASKVVLLDNFSLQINDLLVKYLKSKLKSVALNL